MKNLRNALYVLLAMVASMQLTSCLDNEESADYSLTEEDYAYYLSSISGMYSGKSYFWNDTVSKQNKTDSIMYLSAYVYGKGDSIIRVSMHPKYLVKSLGSVKDDVKKEAQEVIEVVNKMTTNINVDSKFYFYQKQNGVVYFGVYPSKVTLPITTSDGDHKLNFSFYNYVNYNGAYSNGKIDCQIILTKIELDDKELKKFNVNGNEEDYVKSLYRLNIQK